MTDTREAVGRAIDPIAFSSPEYGFGSQMIPERRGRALAAADFIIAEHIPPLESELAGMRQMRDFHCGEANEARAERDRLREALASAEGHANMEAQKYTEACISNGQLREALAVAERE